MNKFSKFCRFFMNWKPIFSFFHESSEVFCALIISTLFSAMFILACGIFHLDLVKDIHFFGKSIIALFWFCFKLLQFQRLKHPDFSIAILITGTILSVSMLFLFCFFGRLSTEKYEQMSDCSYESKWNELPIELQKFYVIIIGVGQRPLFYHGYGMIYLNLQTFTRVSKCELQSDHLNEYIHLLRLIFFFSDDKNRLLMVYDVQNSCCLIFYAVYMRTSVKLND